VRTRKLLGQTVDVVEVAVRLVLVLLLQFAIIESIVVEAGSDRSSGARAADRGFGGGSRADSVGNVGMDCRMLSVYAEL
jgi:hypothetical protein